MNVTYLKQGENILIGYDGKTLTINPSHYNYTNIKTAISEGRIDDVPSLADTALAIRTYGQGLIDYDESQCVVTYEGEPVHNVISDRLIQMIRANVDVAPLVLFLENLLQNPNEESIAETYLFMECNDLPITPDGHFLAYKRVRANYKDIHSNTFDNSVGVINEMDRSEVDSNRRRTCSTGLHFCGLSYLKHFSKNGNEDHVMILKINPADVVSIPEDYGNAKGRCWKYEVVGEYTDFFADRSKGAFDNNPVIMDYSNDVLTAEQIAEFKKSHPTVKDWVTKIFSWFADNSIEDK